MKNIIENEVGAILTDILDDYKKNSVTMRKKNWNSLHRKQPFLSCGGFQRSVNT